MALSDILAAISAQADQAIADARTAHQKAVTELREASERRIAKKKTEVTSAKEEKKQQLLRKTHAHADAVKRHAVLEKKQELLDRLYDKALENVSALPDDKAEKLLRSCLKTIKGKGTIHPSAKHADLLKKLAPSEQFTVGENIDAKGGFLFVSDKQEENCTFEQLVKESLRPRTELEASSLLFNAA